MLFRYFVIAHSYLKASLITFTCCALCSINLVSCTQELKFYNLATLSILTDVFIFTMNQLKEMTSVKPLINLKQEKTGNSASINGVTSFGPNLPLITTRIPDLM